MERNVQTFIACEASYNEAGTVIFGAPFDSTTSFRPGTRFAPQTIRSESIGIETYSPYQDADLEDRHIFDAGDLELPYGNAERALETIEGFTKKILADGKKPCMIGGEHLVTLGAVRTVYEKYPALRVVHFDAHADLRRDYMGERLSHASVMQRIWHLFGDGRIFQFGIRSGSREEIVWGKEHVSTEMFTVKTTDAVARELGDFPVYLTLDLDVLDPSEFPGTGTPEAGGISWNELRGALMNFTGCNIVGFDICELSPHYDQSGASTALACKTLREMLLAFSKA
ncbi:agmatinase [Synergistaceae bacterium OttesenSCG-928-D05]|nr:agmatinase [Synergistaceae bacterium OttesenSCG-928-D05]